MEKQPAKHTSRRKNPKPAKATVSESSERLPSTNPPAKIPPTPPQTEAVVSSSSQAVIPTPDAVPPQPEPRPTVATTATAPPSTTATIVTESTTASNPTQLMKKWMKKIGPNEKPSEFFARMAEMFKQEEAAPTLTPLKIPPRPLTFTETTTSQALSSHTENPRILSETLIQEQNPLMPVAQTETQPSIPTISPTIPPMESDECIQEEEVVETSGDGEEAEGDEQGSETGDVEGKNLGEIGDDDEGVVESEGGENEEGKENDEIESEKEDKTTEGNDAEEVADEEETGICETEMEVGVLESEPGSAEGPKEIVVLEEE